MLTKLSFWQQDWALGYHSMKFRQFPDISLQGFPQGSGQWGEGIQNCPPPSGDSIYGGGGNQEGDIFDMGRDIKNLQICK